MVDTQQEKPTKVTQSMLVSDKEIAMIKDTFADNDELLQLIRNLFFGLALTKTEKDLIKSTFKDEDFKKCIRKRFLPGIAKDVPVGQTVDLWTGVEVEGKFDHQIIQIIQARELLIKNILMSLDLLDNPDGPKFDLSFVYDTNDTLGVKLLARNKFISHVEVQLVMLKIIAGKKVETPDEAKKRLTQNSNK